MTSTEWEVEALIMGVPRPSEEEYEELSAVFPHLITRHDTKADAMRLAFRFRIDGDSSSDAIEEGGRLMRAGLLAVLGGVGGPITDFRVHRIETEE